ncbi:MAG: hypothetical protein Q4F66_02910 [Clostridium sp.]|nr:hypothetical protein [Clostridium sp.]
MKCRKCGFELTGRFCEHCGEPAPEPEPKEEPVQDSEKTNNDYVDNSSDTGNNYNNKAAGNNSYTNKRINNNVDFDKVLKDVPKIVDDISKSNIWIIGLKILAGIEFAIITIAAVIIGLMTMAGRHGDLFEGILIIVIGVFIAFISVALLMVFLNMAQDISKIRSKLNQKLK